jgi:hypothetical protein
MTAKTKLVAVSRNKIPSKKLLSVIKGSVLNFKKFRDQAKEAVELGEKEGFTAMEIGNLIREEMLKHGLSLRTVQRYLPAEAKGKPRGASVSKGKEEFSDKNGANNVEPEQNINISVTEDSSHLAGENQEESESGETDSQKLRKKILSQHQQEPQEKENTDISVTQEEQSASTTKESGYSLSIRKINEYNIEQVNVVALHFFERSDKQQQYILDLEEDNDKLKARIAELENNNEKQPTSKSKKEKTTLASYGEHKHFAVSNGIKSRDQWRKYMKDNTDQLPTNITTRPDKAFAGKGWEGWKSFFA